MCTYFNGYRYPGVADDAPLFASQQCLWFLQLLTSGQFDYLLKNDSWKTYEPSKLINKIADPNSLISDNVFGLLARSPISSRDILELASRPVDCDVDELGTTYRLHQMVAPTEGDDRLSPTSDDVKDSLARSRAFMFSHGMVTLATGSESETTQLVVPNRIAHNLFLRNLDKRLRLRSVDIGRIFDIPTANVLSEFLQSIVDRMQTLHDDNSAEVALQAELESFIRALILRAPRYRVVCEAEHVLPGDAPTKKGYSDLLLVDTHSDIAIVVEMQRIRLRDIHPQRNNHQSLEHCRQGARSRANDQRPSLGSDATYVRKKADRSLGA